MSKRNTFLAVLMLLSLTLTASTLAQQAEKTGPSALAATLPGVLLSTESLLGSTVKNSQGDTVGDIAHLLINPRTGQIRYAIVAIGGFLGLGKKSIIVPWQALEVTRDSGTLVLHVPKQLLQAAPPYATGQEATPTERREEEVYGLDRSGGWGPGTPYGRLYNPAQEQTIRGTVTSVEAGMPMAGMTSGLQLQVRTEDDKTMLVHLGPEWYLEQQEMELQPQASVQITGALAEVNGQSVLLAREVQSAGHTLMLRDAKGMPMWSGLQRETK